MDAVTLSRLQFATVTIYHFFFVPLTLGLSILVAIMETLYVSTKKEVFRQMTHFWGKLFVINFAMGVVTGIVQEFQFGMNWSEYSRFVGDIFGAPLAIEALVAFFLESTFLGLWIFGWDKVSPRMHAAAMWIVAIASNVSALWILIANSFMQQPVGYVLNNGRAEMTDFFAVIFNPNIWTQFPHVVTSGLTTACFFVLGISAYHLMKKGEHGELFRQSFQIAATIGILATLGVAMTGHSQMQHLVESQPMKVAAAEALWDTENPAGLSLLTIGNEKARKDVFAIRVPSLLSLLALDQANGEVKGINQLQAEYEQTYGPGDYVPPVAISYWSFRLMVGAGTLMLVAAAYALLTSMGGEFEGARLLRFFPLLIAFPFLANSTGWILTEVGRYPWLVFGLMKVPDGISLNVSTGALWTTLLGFTLLYGLLMVADVYLLVKFARKVTLDHPTGHSEPQPAVSIIGD